MGKLGFHKKLSLLIMLIMELMILSSCGKREPSPEKEVDVHSGTRPGIVMSGGMNEWLSDGKMALFVDKFYKDPTDSSRMYYRVRFTLKNLTQHIVELHRIEVQFMTSDLVQTVQEKLGEQAERGVQPFQQTIQWSSNLGKPQESLVAHVVESEGSYQFESSGHFFLGRENPSCNVTFYHGHEVVAGPFHVKLGEHLPK